MREPGWCCWAMGAADSAPWDRGGAGIAIGFCPGQLQTQPVMAQLLIVSQQQRRTIDLGQHHVQVAVAVYIRKRRTAANDRLEQVGPGLFRRHDEKSMLSGAFRIPEQLCRLTVALARLYL